MRQYRMKKQITSVSARNLRRDRNVLGKKWAKTYRGYFGQRRPMTSFIESISLMLPHKKNISIFYPGSANGLLGERLVRDLEEKGTRANLTLMDISVEHLNANTNPKTRKIVGDLLNFKLGQKYDVVIQRSSLDYLPTRQKQVIALQNIRKAMAKGGIFFNQAASMPSKIERDLADAIYHSNNRIGHRHFQWEGEINDLYEEAGFREVTKIADAPVLIITNKEHQERYQITNIEIQRIRRLIARVPKNLRPNIQLTKMGYRMIFTFPIYAAE